MTLTNKEQKAILDKQVADWKKELAHLASQIGAATGKNCAVVLVQSVDEDYAHAPASQIFDDAVRVSPGYKIELLNPTNCTGKMTNSRNATMKSSGAGSFMVGLLLGLLPPILLFLFGRSTFIIATRPLASWSVDLYVLIGTAILLIFSKKLNEGNRRAVEWTLFLGAFALFVTKWMMVGMPT